MKINNRPPLCICSQVIRRERVVGRAGCRSPRRQRGHAVACRVAVSDQRIRKLDACQSQIAAIRDLERVGDRLHGRRLGQNNRRILRRVLQP